MKFFKEILLATVLGVISVTNSDACTVLGKPIPYEDYIASLREPKFANIVRMAATIDLAVATSQRKTDQPEPWNETRGKYDGDDVYKSRYFFTVSEKLKGNSDNEYEYTSQFGKRDQQAIPFYQNNDVVIGPSNFDSFTSYNAEIQHRNSNFWENGFTTIGNTISPGDCDDYVWFDIGTTYLVFRDKNGAFISAEQIDAPHDIWLIAVRNLIVDPDRDFGYAIYLRNFIKLQYSPSMITVRSCRNPTLEISDLRTNKTNIEENDSVYDDDESYRFIEYPFTKDTCRVGNRYYSNSDIYGQWFEITDGDLVDLTDIAGQLKIKDPRKVPLAELRSWLE